MNTKGVEDLLKTSISLNRIESGTVKTKHDG